MATCPVSRLAILAGRVLRAVVMPLVQGIVPVLAGVAFGLRAPLGGILVSPGFIGAVAAACLWAAGRAFVRENA